jgi:serine/threonine protein kinase
VSPQAKDYVLDSMERDNCRRLSAQQAMQHPWMANAERLSVDEQKKHKIMNA